MFFCTPRPNEFIKRWGYYGHNVRIVFNSFYSKTSLKASIINQLKTCVNNADGVTQENSIDRNLSILQGLCLIVEKSECSDLLTELIDSVFPSWMEEIIQMSKLTIPPI